VIVASHITKVFPRRRGFLSRRGSIRAVDGVSLAIREGEMLGIIGRSGSGKTTLGMILCDAIEPTSGSITLERADRRLRAQMVFQDPRESLSPRMQVRDLIAEPLVIARVPQADRQRRVLHVMDEVQLAETLAGRYPHELSGGQRQRVAVARAVIGHPDIVVADEPTSMLDATVAAGIVELLRELSRSEGLALVLISHDVAQAASVCDRIAVMDAGRIVETGPPARICVSPQSREAQALVAAARVRESSLARQAPRSE